LTNNNRGVNALLISQFLSAFSDNAILFAVIAIVLKSNQIGDWYVPALQGVFLISFVVLAPWVGPFADKYSKPRVLIIGNLFKALGVGLILLNVEPLIAYAMVGLGAAIYSPAKYGILPEMIGRDSLVKANSWIEGSTITAIILGTLAGGKLADISINYALIMVTVCYLLSIIATLFIPHMEARGGTLQHALIDFSQMIRDFMKHPRSRFAMLGGSLFWGAAAVMRILLVAWAPLVLATRSAGDISELALFLAIGVIIGSALAPKLIPMEHLRRIRLPAFGMGLSILLFGLVETVWPARLVLLLIGIAGGLFIVPINATLQEIGHTSIGSGRAVAIQNFFQNAAMLLTVGLYTGATAVNISLFAIIVTLGVTVIISILLVSIQLPDK
jgi:LPLT family lysophospholipid transporter-like MFS transporter